VPEPTRLAARGGGQHKAVADEEAEAEVRLGIYPIVTFQYSSTTLYQVSYHIQYLFF
jgi:hypothetical protein